MPSRGCSFRQSRQGLPPSRAALVHLPCSRTPAEPSRQALRRSGVAPTESKVKAPAFKETFRALSHGFCPRCLRFTRTVTGAYARLASVGLPGLHGRAPPAGPLRKVSALASSFHGLAVARRFPLLPRPLPAQENRWPNRACVSPLAARTL